MRLVSILNLVVKVVSNLQKVELQQEKYLDEDMLGAESDVDANLLYSLAEYDNFYPEDETQDDMHRVQKAVAEGAVGLARLQVPLSVKVVQTSPAELVLAPTALHEFAA